MKHREVNAVAANGSRWVSTTIAARPTATRATPHRNGTMGRTWVIRMKERSFTVLALLSVAMLMWSLNLWEKGYDRGGCVGAGHIWSFGDGSVVMLGGGDGRLYVHFLTGRDWDRKGTENDRWEILGVVCSVIRDPTGTFAPKGFVVSRLLSVPAWMPTLGFALLPAVWSVRQWKLATRNARGRCLVCGYDMRATPERCPECGVVPAEAGIEGALRSTTGGCSRPCD